MATVLVVDDEPDMLMQLRRALETAGHEVVLAPDGRLALAKVAERPPHVVVLDLLMPVLGGLAVLQDLQRQANGTPVIILLAGAEAAGEGRKAMELGALGFVTKPFDVDDLCNAIDDVLGLRSDDDREAYRQGSLGALAALG